MVAVACEVGCDRGTLGRWVERVAKVAEPARLAARVLLAATDQLMPPAPPARPASGRPTRRA